MKFSLPSRESTTLSLEQVLEQFGRKGGGTPYGWHTFAPTFQCWFKHYLITHLKIERTNSPALAIGTILHELLAMWYSTPLGEEMNGEADRLLQLCRENGYELAVEEAARLMIAYIEYWQVPRWDKQNQQWERAEVIHKQHGTKTEIVSKPDTFWDDNTKILAIEELLETSDPFNYTCRMDMAIERPDGIWVVDHKTAKALDPSVTDWSLQGEILGLLWLAQQKWGEKLKGLIINLIVKTKTPKFERLMFRLRQENIDAHIDAINSLKLMEPMAAGLGWPRNFTACNGQYRCQFYDYCKDGSKIGLKEVASEQGAQDDNASDDGTE